MSLQQTVRTRTSKTCVGELYEFKRIYQTRNNLVKDGNGDLLADFHNILNRWKNYFPQLLNVHNASDVRQIEVHMSGPLVPGPGLLEVEIAIANMKKYKSADSDKIPSELIQAGNEMLVPAIQKLVNSIWNMKDLPNQWKESIIVPLPKKGDKTYCNTSTYRGISLLSTSYKILSNILLSRLSPYIDEIIGDHQCGFRRNRSTTDKNFCIPQIPEKKWDYSETVHQLRRDFKKVYVSVRKEGLYNILIEFRVSLRQVRLIKVCLNETYSKDRIGKNLSDSFPIQNCLKQGDVLSPLLLNFPL
jgi:hypothetical protein